MRILTAHDAEGNLHHVVVSPPTRRPRQLRRRPVYW